MLCLPLFLCVLHLLYTTHAYVIPIRRTRLHDPYMKRLLFHRHKHRSPRELDASTPSQPTSIQTIPSAVTSIATSASDSVSLPLQTPSPPPGNGLTRKYVIAHHMVGNTYPYVVKDWLEDVTLAHASSIDGFALNTGREEWEPARISDAYQAALQSGLDFKLFLSLDMTSLPCNSPDDAQSLRDLVKRFMSHPNQLLYEDKAFVSTFAGDACTFGQSNAVDGWKDEFVNHPDLQGKIYFVPAFFVDPTKFGDFREVMNGDFNWNSGWPIQVTTAFARNLIASVPSGKTLLADGAKVSSIFAANVNAASQENDGSDDILKVKDALSAFIGSTDTDRQHLDQLSNLTPDLAARSKDSSRPVYMAAVSPWFFTHYSPETFNKNFIYMADQHLYSRRWESLIDSRDQIDLVQIVTWNDYGESHYIGPIKGAQPNSQAWVNGMDHTGWLNLTQYYATAFKAGEYPAIEKDQIFMWARPHSAQANAPDSVGRPANFELVEDAVWAVVLARAPATVTLSTSSSNSQSFEIPAGLSKLSIPISPGDTMRGIIERDGQAVVELSSSNFTFQGSPPTYNFNAFVASASAS